MSDGSDPDLKPNNEEAKVLYGFNKTQGTDFSKDVISATDREFIRC
jgi:hypothetical protein